MESMLKRVISVNTLLYRAYWVTQDTVSIGCRGEQQTCPIVIFSDRIPVYILLQKPSSTMRWSYDLVSIYLLSRKVSHKSHKL